MRSRSLVGAIALAVLMAGCTTPPPAPTSSASPSTSDRATSTETPKPTSTASSEPAAKPLTIPGCEILVPIELARANFSDATEYSGESAAARFPLQIEVSGAQAALAGASVFRGCGWAVPMSDGAFRLAVASITPETRASLQAALVTAGFSSVTMGTVTGFDAEADGMVSSLGATYLFTGDVMIVGDGTGTSLTGAITGSALDALRTANPTLSL